MARLWKVVIVLLALAGIASMGQSLPELARQQREKARVHPLRVYTNDTLPQTGGISVIGPSSGPAAATAAASRVPSDAATALSHRADQEAMWRKRFADARQQLQLDQGQLNVAQKELNLARMQYYSDPNVALHQQYDQTEVKKKGSQIELLQRKVQADQDALSRLSDQLRREGLPPGWGRE